jgi:hypothetical protein
MGLGKDAGDDVGPASGRKPDDKADDLVNGLRARRQRPRRRRTGEQ